MGSSLAVTVTKSLLNMFWGLPRPTGIALHFLRWTPGAGGRWTFAEPVTQRKISYIQVYTSDKAALYNAGQRQKIPMLAGTRALRLLHADEQIELVREIYNSLIENHNKFTPVVMRIEARVPFNKADTFGMWHGIGTLSWYSKSDTYGVGAWREPWGCGCSSAWRPPHPNQLEKKF
ncbi:hypothetical protein B0H14DRAFT_2611508 [Mycena olivaceomarginata]|nr:hypothetical protein B0H14DRAFT_2611508 [Mycena olivaceomarginata]